MGTTLTGPLDEDRVMDAWPKVEAFIDSAIAREGWKYTTGDILQQIGEGQLGLYIVTDDETGEILAAIACEVQEYPRRNVFNIAFCGGRDLYRWAGLLGQLEADAVRFGCDTVSITGRPGWGRVFPDYAEVHRVFERKVVM